MMFKLSPKHQRQWLLTASLTLSIWYLLMLWDLARGNSLPWLAPYLSDLLQVGDGALVVIAGLVPLVLVWGGISRLFAHLALQQLAVDLKRKRRPL